VQEHFIDVDGIRTRYLEAGEGEPLVLFHGGNFGYADNVDCAENWDRNIPGLARAFHVYAVDKLGQGFTDNPKTDADYTIEAVVQHAYGVLRALGLTRVNLVGHSRGGYLVTRLTREHPEMVSALVIVDSATTAPGDSRKLPFPPEAAPRPLLSPESLRWVAGAYSYSADHITERWQEVRCRIAQTPKNREAVEQMARLDKTQFLPSLLRQKEDTLNWIREKHLRCPTLVIWGYNDPSAKVRSGYDLFDLIAASTARAQMNVFNQAGHYSYREHPEDFNAVVTRFIEGCATGATTPGRRQPVVSPPA
jgi:2-hydroxy-6-oxonona-2,4-dienedioate hydrolase